MGARRHAKGEQSSPRKGKKCKNVMTYAYPNQLHTDEL